MPKSPDIPEKEQVIITHSKCGTKMKIYGVTKSDCMGWYSVTFYCPKCKTDVEIDEMGTEKVRRS